MKVFGTFYELDRHIMHSSLLAKYVRITLDVYKAAEGQLEESGFLCERDICTMKIEKEGGGQAYVEILPILDEMRKRRSTIASSAFYQKQKEVDVRSLDEAIFPTQMQAFNHFDSLHNCRETKSQDILCSNEE